MASIRTTVGNEGAGGEAPGTAAATSTALTSAIPGACNATSFLARRDNANDSDLSDGEDSAPLIAKRVVVTPDISTPAIAIPSDASSECDYDSEEEARLSSRWTCQTIRSKIQKFLATKTMTQTAFLKTIGANSNSFGRFMKLKGSFEDEEGKSCGKGKQRQAKTAVKRKAVDTDKDDDETPAAKKKKFLARLEQIEAVELAEDIKVFDDCDVVRDNIQAFLLTKVMTQTALSAHLNVSVAALRKFLACKGKREGVGIVYKAAYRFFEKTRLLDNAPKTNKRKKVETDRPQGYSLERDPTRFLVHISEINPKVRW
ncbi:hypothetical protein DYB35_003852 [Aphanomyces astaci]|uniref:DUF7726 domain-containing protein n=1 Tax=Aphanomyces astaci TaxID=112090 RepID=A0A3R7A318_APHAT|nr:hypothetical protein DYB35_003852 [Aphanomyces astaci]